MRSWNAFNDRNVRSRLHARVWTMRVMRYAVETGLVDPETAVLDYGCGTFELGIGLAPHCHRVDGFDPHPASAATARHRASGLGNTTIYDRVDDLLPLFYDVIIVNSVIQYFDSADELEAFLSRSAGLLKPTGKRAVLVADILPLRYSPSRDAFDALRAAARHGFLREMLSHLARSAMNGHRTRLARYDRHAFAKRAAAHGFRPQFLTENLTPFRQRYSTLLTLEA